VKKIIFKNICIKNFLSVGDNEINISFQNGINLLTGINNDNNTRNGVGKSSVIESIYWCLFGTTIRDIKNDKIIHNQQKKGCEVVLTFQVANSDSTINQYVITRTLGPSKIQIFKDGVDVTLSTIPNNDDYIKQIIGATPEVFNNAVIMTANNTMPFMAQKKIDKRKFIEGVLNLNIFTDMLLKARADYNDTKKENDILCNNFVNFQKNLETFENQKLNEDKRKKENVDRWQYNIEVCETSIKDCENKQFPELSNIDNQITELETTKLSVLKNYLKTYNDTNSEIITKKSTLTAEVNVLKREKQKIIDKGNVCPSCNREYCKDDIDSVKNKLTELDNDIASQENELGDVISKKSTCDNNIKAVEGGIEKVNTKIKDLNKFKSLIKDNEHAISKYNHEINQFRQFINNINNEKSIVDSNVENTKKEAQQVKEKLERVKERLSILDSAKFVLSEEGVKSYIVKKLLTFLNQKLNFYLKALDAPCTCEFDELFEEKIINNEGNDCSYFNFSGGERKRIDVAVLFMFQDVLRLYSGTSFSLSMYDELFDSAIDEAGIEKILEILKKRIEDYDESIYIVSHNKSSIKSNFDNIIFLEKNNGKTQIQS
jgi:DNA repair exonuclease SbcCD ATPase subunit